MLLRPYPTNELSKSTGSIFVSENSNSQNISRTTDLVAAETKSNIKV